MVNSAAHAPLESSGNGSSDHLPTILCHPRMLCEHLTDVLRVVGGSVEEAPEATTGRGCMVVASSVRMLGKDTGESVGTDGPMTSISARRE
jgi:hypothetical protein